MPRSIRFVVPAIFAVALTAIPSHGASQRGSRPELAATARLTILRLWSFAGGWWQSKALGAIEPSGQATQSKEAGAADPHGLCASGQGPACGQQVGGEEAGALDPNGGEEAGAVDPNG